MQTGSMQDNIFKAFTATAVALEEGVRVVLGSGGTISVAAAASPAIGVTMQPIAASGTGTVRLWSPSVAMQTAGPVTCAALLYTAAAGEVDDTGTYRIPFVAGETATAQGDFIECYRIDNLTTTVGTLLAADIATLAASGTNQATGAIHAGKIVTFVTAADDTTGVTLPTAAVGNLFYIINTVYNKHLHVYPAVGEYINGVQNTGISLGSGNMGIFLCAELTKWGFTGVVT